MYSHEQNPYFVTIVSPDATKFASFRLKQASIKKLARDHRRNAFYTDDALVGG